MKKPVSDKTTRGSSCQAPLLRGLGLAACFLAVFVATGHVFEHSLANSPSTMAPCRICGTLAACAAQDPVQLQAPAAEFSLSAESTAVSPIAPKARPDTSRAPPPVR